MSNFDIPDLGFTLLQYNYYNNVFFYSKPNMITITLLFIQYITTLSVLTNIILVFCVFWCARHNAVTHTPYLMQGQDHEHSWLSK